MATNTELPRTMKALQLERHDTSAAPTMRLTELPVPAPGPKQLLIKIHASAIQPSDQMNAKGGFPTTTYPRVPGRDFSGTVVGAGASATNVPIGTAVFGTSGYTAAFTEDGYQAEYAVVPEGAVARKPEHVSFVQAAATGVPYTTADLILSAASPVKGETVLILGANGAVGRAAQVLAKARGLHVLRGVRGDKGDVDTQGDPELKGARNKTGGKGPDIVLDTIGQLELTQNALLAMASFGRYVTIAAPRSGSRELKLDVFQFYRDNKTFRGVNSVSVDIETMGQHLRDIGDSLAGEEYQTLAEKWEEVPLTEGVQAYEKSAGRTKCVIVMQ